MSVAVTSYWQISRSIIMTRGGVSMATRRGDGKSLVMNAVIDAYN